MWVDDPDIRVSSPDPRERRVAVLLFMATLVCVYLVYGYQWTDGDPLRDGGTAWESAQFASALMAILLAHEMGHYWVARRHGFELSLPYFLPFPMAFGTFGAIIRLRSLPPNRTALLEMGAAGPLAGFVVAVVVMALGLPETVPQAVVELPMARPPPIPEIVDGELTGWAALLDGLLGHPPLSWIFPPVEPETLPLLVLANPPVMDLVGSVVMGAAPGRYDILGPLALAGWVGCLLTAINLV
ncbi:MAG: site-2 protease family protein, partial [Myxococcota bacterium]|nr:site-2 protease family protein [Myxococcota bacterium]